MSRLLIFCVLLLSFSTLVVPRAAGEEKPAPKAPEKLEFVNGKITKISAKSITISEHKQATYELTTLTIDESTKVVLPPPEGSTGANRKPRDGKVSDLKKGDIAAVSYRKEGMVAIKVTVAEPFKAHPKG